MRRIARPTRLQLAGPSGCAHEHPAAPPMSLPSGNVGLFDSPINRHVEPGRPTL